ncbi:hypothetical protein B7495_18210 (plasmid) [Cryobacterium sp. LW097]|nr:hypothetical protein B7495_18210 [Cryobacterium sp. LW097]
MFPNAAALLRLAGLVLIEQHDEWGAGERRYFSEASMLELATRNSSIEVLDGAISTDIDPAWRVHALRGDDGTAGDHHRCGRVPAVSAR